MTSYIKVIEFYTSGHCMVLSIWHRDIEYKDVNADQPVGNKMASTCTVNLSNDNNAVIFSRC